MTRNYQESDLPDFLQNSSLIPVSSGNDEFALSSHVQPPVPRPSLSQILRSKWMRNVITALFFIIAFLFLRSQGKKHNVLAHMGLGGPKCLLKEPISVPPVQQGDVDWSQFAYVQYVTNPDYLCNSVMLFESLHRLGSKADRLLMYPATYSLDKTSAYEGYLLLKARDEYNVTLVPVDIMSKNLSFRQWAQSYTKLLAFNQTTYSRLLLLDSDALLFAHLDELFFIPPARAAMPKAYWLEKPTLTSHIMVITPSTEEFTRVEQAVVKATDGVYDMEIMNSLYGNDCVVLPHQKYALLTGEFRKDDHSAYLGSDGAKWDAGIVRSEAKYVHFSDDPLPKPWMKHKAKDWDNMRPLCETGIDGKVDCRSRDIWGEFYDDFKIKRKNICEFDLFSE